jgi:hypothetical protein
VGSLGRWQLRHGCSLRADRGFLVDVRSGNKR